MASVHSSTAMSPVQSRSMRLKDSTNSIFSAPPGMKEKVITPPETSKAAAKKEQDSHTTPKAKSNDDLENWKGNPWSQEEVSYWVCRR